MKKTALIGLLICIVSLTMMHRSQWAIGLIGFIIGILVMNKK